MEMTFTKAVNMIKSGDSVEYNRGYEYLYYATYNVNKWDIEKILGNEQDAEDILQNAYIKMLSKIDTLEDPEKFPAWFNRLATNMAIDVWRAQHPKKKGDDSGDSYRRVVSFSEFEYTDGDGEAIEYEWEDESIEFRPEEAYTQQETVDMVHEMLKNLPEEQKACLIMFHLQGLSIKEIAEDMQVSENTVKSRLNYARKNIEAQGEELKKKGYQLYSYAPLPLLLCLLGAQRGSAVAADSYWAGVTVSNWSMGVGSAAATGEAVVQGSAAMSSSTAYGAAAATGQGTAGAVAGQTGVGAQVEVGVQAGVGAQTGIGTQAGAQMAGQAGTTGMQQAVTQAAVKTAGKKAAGGFLGTIGGKVAVAVGSVALITVGTIAITNHIKDKDETTTTEQLTEVTEEVAETTEVTTEATTEEVIDERGLLVTYYQDTLVPEYGLMPEYQANENPGDAVFDGIYISDMDDYNGDGVLDLLVCRFENKNNYTGGIESIESREYGDHCELYTVVDGQVKELSKYEGTVEYVARDERQMSGVSESAMMSGISEDIYTKVKVDNKVFVVKAREYFTQIERYGELVVYGMEDNKYVPLKRLHTGVKADSSYFHRGFDYIGGVEQESRLLYYPMNYYGSEEEYINHYGKAAEGITEEQYIAETGINCNVDENYDDFNSMITFQHDSEVLCHIYNGGKDGIEDASVNVITNQIDTGEEAPEETNTSEADVDERSMYEAHIRTYLEGTGTGYIPDYKQDIFSNSYRYDGVQYYDIDDYNHDGVLDLFLIIRYTSRVDEGSTLTYCDSSVGHYYYTIEDGKIKQIGETLYTNNTGFYLPHETEDVNMCKQVDQLWKVKVDNNIYFVEKKSCYFSDPKTVSVYGFEGNQIRLLRMASKNRGWDVYNEFITYENGEPVENKLLENTVSEEEARGLAESFLAELGINCVIVDSDDNMGNTIEFENEATLVYELHNCGKADNFDATIQYTAYYDRIEDEDN